MNKARYSSLRACAVPPSLALQSECDSGQRLPLDRSYNSAPTSTSSIFAVSSSTRVGPYCTHNAYQLTNDKIVKSHQKPQIASGKSDRTGDKPGETEHAKEAPILEEKPLAAKRAVEDLDNTDTELVELRLPDEAVALERILAEIQEPTQGHGLGANDHPGDIRSTEEAVRDALRAAGNDGLIYVGRIGYKVKEVDYPEYAKKAINWAAAHPYSTALHVGMGILILSPGLLATPVLSVAGFTGSGIAAGSAAAARHATIRTMSSPSILATLQSAGASGYGLPIVHSVIRVGSAATSGLLATAFGKRGLPAAKGTLLLGSINEEKAEKPEQSYERGLPDHPEPAKEATQQAFLIKALKLSKL